MEEEVTKDRQNTTEKSEKMSFADVREFYGEEASDLNGLSQENLESVGRRLANVHFEVYGEPESDEDFYYNSRDVMSSFGKFASGDNTEAIAHIEARTLHENRSLAVRTKARAFYLHKCKDYDEFDAIDRACREHDIFGDSLQKGFEKGVVDDMPNKIHKLEDDGEVDEFNRIEGRSKESKGEDNRDGLTTKHDVIKYILSQQSNLDKDKILSDAEEYIKKNEQFSEDEFSDSELRSALEDGFDYYLNNRKSLAHNFVEHMPKDLLEEVENEAGIISEYSKRIENRGGILSKIAKTGSNKAKLGAFLFLISMVSTILIPLGHVSIGTWIALNLVPALAISLYIKNN